MIKKITQNTLQAITFAVIFTSPLTLTALIEH